jgi:hypothetical protein
MTYPSFSLHDEIFILLDIRTCKKVFFYWTYSNLIGQSIRKDNEVITAILLLYFSSPTQPTKRASQHYKILSCWSSYKFQKYVLIQPEQGSTSIT